MIDDHKHSLFAECVKFTILGLYAVAILTALVAATMLGFSFLVYLKGVLL